MRYFRLSLLAVLAMVSALLQAQRNVLVADTVKAPAGVSVAIPVALENTSDITGVQFDISVPYELLTEGEEAGTVVAVTPSRLRIPNHTVSVRKKDTQWKYYYPNGVAAGSTGMTYHRYRVIVYSQRNELVVDDHGTLLTLQLQTDLALQSGALLPVFVENVTLTSPGKEDVKTGDGMRNGAVVIENIPRPDLAVSGVTFTPATVSPGGTVSVSWVVANVGDKETGAGWTEQVSLVNLAGTVTKTVATAYYDQTLPVGSQVSRQAEVQLPQNLGLDGICKVRVEAVPGDKTGEHPSMRENNVALSATNINLAKQLSLELSKVSFVEGGTQRVQAKVSRSGSWTMSQTFHISVTPDDNRFDIPGTVSIPAGQSGVVFYFNVLDDDVLDPYTEFDITVTGTGYEAATQHVTIEDDELPQFAIAASKSVLNEGEQFTLTVTIPEPVGEPTTVKVISEDNKRFLFNSTAVIPAGQTQTVITVTCVDDDLPQLEQSNKFTVTSKDYDPAEVIVILRDNDIPALTLELTPAQVSEGDGPTAVAAVLTRTGVTNNKITVKLTDDSDGSLYYSNKSITMDKGVETVFFNLGPIDNTIQEGDRTYTLNAAIWISSCSCAASGESAGSVQATLRVLDNDGAALSVASQASTIKEGGQTTVTVSRNTLADLSQALTVTLSSNMDSDLEYPKSLTIPAGQASASVTVKSLANSVSGDSHTVIFTVSATGYASGTCVLMVTDQTLPDARALNLQADTTESTIGTKVTVSVTIRNEGAYPLPAQTPVTFYRKGQSTNEGTSHTSREIAVGDSETVQRVITLPTQVDTYTYYAVVNAERKVGELVYTNNTSNDIAVKATSPFTATVQTDKLVYRQNAVVAVSGQMSGEGSANSMIDVYMINDGAREVKQVSTDDNGRFTLNWQLYDKQSGHFTVGACYRDDPTTEEMAAFDVYGLKRTENSYITCQATVGEAYGGSLTLVNAGSLPLTGVGVEVIGGPEGLQTDFSIPANIAANETVTLRYSLTGTVASQGDSWEMIRIRVVSAEGAALEIPIHFYARVASGNLVISSRTLNTTVVKSLGRDLSFALTNTGKGNTGRISLSLPDFIKPLTGTTMPGLNQNDTATIVLRIQPTDDMQLNVPVTGMLGINCENGNGTYMNYSIMPVSNVNGTLVVDVTDEFTYYTDEKPHVAGAEVVLRNPVTGALVAQGTTGADGLFTITLPEGYYQLNVTADKHDAYRNNVLVDPEGTTTRVINLSYQAISVTWNVEETEVEDEYSIVTTVKYETNVPTPVVETVAPESLLELQQLGVGESLIYYAVLTNKGLIQAEDVGYTLPEYAGDFRWEALVPNENLTLAPQQSYTIPVKVTRMESGAESRRASGSGGSNCHTVSTTVYWWECGSDHKWHKYSKPVKYTECERDAYTIYGGGGGGVGGPGGGGGSSYSSTQNSDAIYEGKDCSPCKENIHKVVKWAFDCAISFVDIFQIGCWYGLYSAIMSHESVCDAVTITSTTVGCVASMVKNDSPIGFICNIVNCVATAVDLYVSDCGAPPPPSIGPGDVPGGSGGGVNPPDPRVFHAPKNPFRISPSEASATEFLDVFAARNFAVKRWLENYLGYYDEILGTRRWQECMTMAERDDLIAAFAPYMQRREHVTAEALRLYKPQDISTEQLDSLVERINNTIDHDLDSTRVFDNMMNGEIMRYRVQIMNELDEFIKGLTGETVLSLFSSDTKGLLKRLDEESGSTCATISLQIDQTMTMTRQAFRGTLTVTNGNETIAMENVKLKLAVTNRQSNLLATEKEFDMHTETLKGFEGDLDMESGWTLAPTGTGTATILFTPSKFAAPDEPVDYSFGGTLSYVDPNTGLEVTRDLYPVTLTVKPSPELDLTYFMQRDLYGDDPLTEDIEPVVPGEFAVVINNKGNGDATNVRMVTKQPRIIENEKGLFIDFEFVSSQLNGQEKALAMGESIPTEFGNIPAHTQAYAQWWLQSSLLGHFVGYDIQATHVSSYGNENLSLLDQVTIHELIHGFTPSAGSVSDGSAVGRGFLVNDISDMDDLPDQVYFTDGTQADVSVTTDATMQKKSDTEYTLTVYPQAEGWNYGSVLDPTVGRRKLLGVVRLSDNCELPVDNVWQTDRTLVDTKDWHYENRLHFVDDYTASSVLEGVSYRLTFEDRSDVVLEVASITGMELNGKLVREDYVDQVTVTFNKAVQPETFTKDDLTFAVQGQQQDLTSVEFTSEDNTVWTLDFTELNRTLPNGYYVLTVQTADIKDYEGYNGYVGCKADWVLFLGGLVQLRATEFPLYSGTIVSEKLDGDAPAGARLLAPTDGNVSQTQYGDRYRFTATANEGYEFVNWTLGGEVISTNPVYETTVNGDMDLVANFKRKQYRLDLAVTGSGTLAGNGIGCYDHGSELAIVAQPLDEFVLKSWVVNGTPQAATDTLHLTLTSATTVEAVFVRDIFMQTLSFSDGWNWTSTFLREQQPLGNVATFANRVLTQQDELILDPQFGLVGGISTLAPATAYKVEANTAFSISMRGHLYAVDEAAAIGLQQGWNWMGYPGNNARPLSTVITNAEEGDALVSQTAFATYEGGTWEPAFDLVPGQGYLYRSASAKELCFSFAEASGSRGSEGYGAYGAYGAYGSVVDPHRYPSTMNIIARIYRDGIELPADHYTVYATAPDGELRGVSQAVGQNHYLTVYGEQPVGITFVVESVETGETFGATPQLTFTSDIVGSRSNPFAVTISTPTGIVQSGTSSQPMTVYTLDGILVSRDATLKQLRTLPKGIYIVNGQKCFVRP